MARPEELRLIVVSPEKTLFDGQVDIVTFPGKAGSFSVLRDHAPLVSVLKAGEVRYKEKDSEQTIAITGGFVEVKDNVVSVCVEL